ncbi:hypothetical protein [Zoogloea sp.]|uniref:hypothetical protein n=1 Tax=Zoogloea sp. TaxID=49181 RepID=UPI0035B1042E
MNIATKLPTLFRRPSAPIPFISITTVPWFDRQDGKLPDLALLLRGVLAEIRHKPLTLIGTNARRRQKRQQRRNPKGEGIADRFC